MVSAGSSLRWRSLVAYVVMAAFAALAFSQVNDSTSLKPKGSAMSDREQAGLRGPVKTCVEETIHPSPDDQPRRSTVATEYTPGGRIIRPGDEEWISILTYYVQGNLPDETSGSAGGPSHEPTYSYDKKGHKTKVETFEPRPDQPNVASAGPPWEGSDLAFVRPSGGGTITTIYGEQDVAIEGQLRNAEGQLVSRIVRTLDSNGKITSEKLIVETPELLIPGESLMAAYVCSGEVSYSYDAEGRMTRKEERGGLFGREATTRIVYNEHGDREEERTTIVWSPEIGREFRLNEDGTILLVGDPPPASPPTEYETRYTYQYDSYGNWIEQSVTSRFSPNEPFAPSVSYRRSLTYY